MNFKQFLAEQETPKVKTAKEFLVTMHKYEEVELDGKIYSTTADDRYQGETSFENISDSDIILAFYDTAGIEYEARYFSKSRNSGVIEVLDWYGAVEIHHGDNSGDIFGNADRKEIISKLLSWYKAKYYASVLGCIWLLNLENRSVWPELEAISKSVKATCPNDIFPVDADAIVIQGEMWQNVDGDSPWAPKRG